MQGDVEFVEDAYQACKGAHSIALVTQWQEYRELDFQRIHDEMVKPAFMFDGRNHLDPQSLHQIGFNVFPWERNPCSIYDSFRPQTRCRSTYNLR